MGSIIHKTMEGCSADPPSAPLDPTPVQSDEYVTKSLGGGASQLRDIIQVVSSSALQKCQARRGDTARSALAVSALVWAPLRRFFSFKFRPVLDSSDSVLFRIRALHSFSQNALIFNLQGGSAHLWSPLVGTRHSGPGLFSQRSNIPKHRAELQCLPHSCCRRRLLVHLPDVWNYSRPVLSVESGHCGRLWYKLLARICLLRGCWASPAQQLELYTGHLLL
jgi:hypothetical protein